MRRLLAALAVLLLTGAALAAENPKASDAVQAALKAQAEAWNKGDLSGFLAMYVNTPTLTAVNSGQVVKGFDALRARYEQSYKTGGQPMGTLKFEDVAVTEIGPNGALSVGKFRLDRDGKPPAEGVFTLVWEKTPAGWRILHDHRSLTPAPAAAADSGQLVVEDLIVGKGDTALVGNRVTVHYTGWLTDGKKFDSSLDRGQPFEFQLGQRHVIAGWEQGVLGMKVGGKRKLTIPPALGYGSRSVGGGLIPANSTLIFEVELLKVSPP